MSRVQHFDGRGRDPRPRKPPHADVASRPRRGETLDRNQNAREGTPAGSQLSVSQVRVPEVVRAAGLTNAEADKELVMVCGCANSSMTPLQLS